MANSQNEKLELPKEKPPSVEVGMADQMQLMIRNNMDTKVELAKELLGEGVERESVARVLHVTPAELGDLLDKAKQQLSLKQAESA